MVTDKITIIREAEDPDGSLRGNVLKYWCNATGDLHRQGDFNITEEDLPAPLRRAFRELWKENAGGANCYLAETEQDGLGIALIGEYDHESADELQLSMPEYLDIVIQDAEILASRETLWSAHIYVLENAGEFPEAHLMIIFLPAAIPERDFDAACETVQSDLYGTLEVQRKNALKRHLIDVAVQHVLEFHESIGDTDIKIGRTKINDLQDMIEVEIEFNWKLNAWEKHVQKTDILVKDSFGYWNLVNGFGARRYSA